MIITHGKPEVDDDTGLRKLRLSGPQLPI
ncbi:hypothetical protein ACO1Y9_15180 [Klebsiella quasipneumoniae]